MPRVHLYLSLLLILLPLNGAGQTALASGYLLQTVAGGDNVGDGGPASSALLIQPQGVAADSRGNVYLADAANHRVRKIAPNGTIATLAGNGHPGFSGDGGPAAAAQLRTPYGVAVDRAGNIYIADLGNARIRRIAPDGTISTFAGGGTTPPAQAVGGPAVESALDSPRNVAVDFYGVVYFSDFTGQRVYQVSASGALTIFAGTGVAGFSGDGGPATRAQLSSPTGLAADAAGIVYIADFGNGRVRTVTRGIMGTLGDGGKPGAQPSIPVSLPIGLAADPDGSLFVADAGANQIVRITPALAATPVGQPARDIVIDAQGNLYACSGAVVYRRPRAGVSSVYAGELIPTHIGDGGPPLNAELDQPAGAALDASGNLYIADTGHHRIRKITAGGTIVTVAGTGVQNFGGDGGPAIAAKLDSPVGVAVDATGNLYIGDSGNHRIRRIDLAGGISTFAGTGIRGRSPDGIPAVRAQLDTPTWLALDRDGTLYFSETGAHSVRRIGAGGQLGTAAGTGTRGYSPDGTAAVSAALDSPQGIALDSAGDLYIADAGNHRIGYVAAPSASKLPSIVTVPGRAASIWRNIRGLAVDANGSVFVADADDQRVFRLDAPGTVLTIAGTGIAEFTSESGAGLLQGLRAPMGIAVDASGTVYLADSANGRIRKLTPSLDSVETPQPAQPTIALMNAASLQPGPVAPGEIVSIFGAGIGPAAAISAQQPAVEIGGTQVLINGRLAPLFFAGPNQINLQMPYLLGDARPCDLQVVANGVVKARGSISLVDSAPAVFTLAAGSGQAAALNEDGTLNGAGNPAARGSVIVLFATGEGQTTPAGLEGRPAGSPGPVPVAALSLKIGTYDAEILYAGAAPGFAGLLQVNARIPAGFAPPGILPVTLLVGSALSQPGVTIAVQ